jgi:hypothetical protein
MRLGKEQAVGYVEDTESTVDDALPVAELTVAQPDGMPQIPAAEPTLTPR